LFHQIDPKLECTGAKSFIITQPQIVKYEQFKHSYPYENLRAQKDDKVTDKRIQNKKMSYTRLLQPNVLALHYSIKIFKVLQYE